MPSKSHAFRRRGGSDHPSDAGRVSLRDMLNSLSLALDSGHAHLIAHHRVVAYAATRVGLVMGLPAHALRNTFLAALMHDLGTVSGQNGMAVQTERIVEADDRHAVFGAKFLENLAPLREPANIIRYHHTPWNRRPALRAAGHEVPVESGLVFFADWLANTVGGAAEVLAAAPIIECEARRQRGVMFDPAVVDAFLGVAGTEGFWLDLASTRLERILAQFELPDLTLSADDLQRFSWLVSVMIDSHSRFTATHSSGVAATAQALAESKGWQPERVADMGIAGYLHDVGKLMIPLSILEKRGPLTLEERHIVKSHTFHTQRILEVVDGLEEITEWAADHHETLSGHGYPFHKADTDLCAGSRILAIADIFTAVTEDRPYRAGMQRDQVFELMRNEVETGALDPIMTECLLDNYCDINGRRMAAQRKQEQRLVDFWACTAEDLSLIETSIQPLNGQMTPPAVDHTLSG